jgi:hypothetical protein
MTASTDPPEPIVSENIAYLATNVVPKPSPPPLKRTIWNQCHSSAAAKHSALVAIILCIAVFTAYLTMLKCSCCARTSALCRG